MRKDIDLYYQDLLRKNGFVPISGGSPFNSIGQSWRLSEQVGTGFYWVYASQNLFDIKIHDFYFHKDTTLTFDVPECLSITYYDSISGDEVSPHRPMNTNCIRSFLGGKIPFKAFIRKNIPIQAIGIEITPDYYEDYLKKRYPDEYVNPHRAFRAIDETSDFPEMILLLKQIAHYRGNGIAAKLFYEAKVAEAVALVVERNQKRTVVPKTTWLSENDDLQIRSLTAYIRDHAADDLTLEQLSKIACMGTTKLKQSFKQATGCTITAYIQRCRMEEAKYLLTHTEMTIAQISNKVGYTSTSRFAQLFKRSMGILPGKYRQAIQK